QTKDAEDAPITVPLLRRSQSARSPIAASDHDKESFGNAQTARGNLESESLAKAEKRKSNKEQGTSIKQYFYSQKLTNFRKRTPAPSEAAFQQYSLGE